MTARFAWRKDGGGIGGVDQVQKERIRALGMWSSRMATCELCSAAFAATLNS
jgi:hypothetical protein